MSKRSAYNITHQKHKTVQKDFSQKRTYCDDKKCKFYGQLAEQGVCYTVVNTKLSKYFKQMFDNAESMVVFNRKHNYKNISDKEKIKWLETEVVCHFMNYTGCLNELIWLRGENAKLRGKLGLFKKD